MTSSRATILFTALMLAAAEGQLRVTRVHEVVRHPYETDDMEVLDVDGDGDDDLIIHGHSNALTVWCKNTGGTFADPAVIETAPRVLNYSMPDLADLEGDGLKDIYPNGNLTRTRNLGGGSFSDPEPLPGKSWPIEWPSDPNFIEDNLQPLPGAEGKDKLFLQRRTDGQHNRFYLLAPGTTGAIEERPLLAGGVPYTTADFYLDRYSTHAWVDLDADGDHDLTHWGEDGMVCLRNRGDDTFDAPIPVTYQDLVDFYCAPVPLRISATGLPSLVTEVSRYTDDLPFIDEYLAIRSLTQDDGGLHFGPENPAHRISLNEGTLYAMVAAPSEDQPGHDELWLRFGVGTMEDPYKENIQAYRYDPVTGWERFVDTELPGRGYGEMFLLRLTPAGPAGLACRRGGFQSVSGDREDKVLWASLDSLRSGTPAWQTIAGPFNDFQDVQLRDLDRDGALDLVSGDLSHGLGGGKSGRIHFIHDIDDERKHQVLDLDDSLWFGGAAPVFGNRIAIGDTDGDLYPDLAVSNGPAESIQFLRNLGSRHFAAPEALVVNGSWLMPLRLDTAGHLFSAGSRIFLQAIGSAPVLRHDVGATFSALVFTDMDGDGDRDVVSSPCPLGNVTGWGKVGPSGSIVSWHFITTAPAYEIRSADGVPQIGWITSGASPLFQRIREGVPGILSSAVTPPPPASLAISLKPIWPPVDLDLDGDFDKLFLRFAPPEESFQTTGPEHLVWQENRGSTSQLHLDPLLHTWHTPASPYGLSVQVVPQPDPQKTRLLFGNGQGEVYQLDLSAPAPGGPFGAWLASFNLSGASAGAESDPDNDGLTNLEEALQGTSPVANTPGTFNIPTAPSSPDGWTFSSALNLSGSGITVTSEVSTDLGEWLELPDEPAFVSESGGRFHYWVVDSAMEGEGKRFVRFRFSWNP